MIRADTRLAGIELYFDDLPRAKAFSSDVVGLDLIEEATGHRGPMAASRRGGWGEAATEPSSRISGQAPDRGEQVIVTGRVLGYPPTGAGPTLNPPPIPGVVVELGLWHGPIIEAMRANRHLEPAEYGITWFEVIATTITDARGRYRFGRAPKWAATGLRTVTPAGAAYEDFSIETSFFLGLGRDRDVDLAVFERH